MLNKTNHNDMYCVCQEMSQEDPGVARCYTKLTTTTGLCQEVSQEDPGVARCYTKLTTMRCIVCVRR